MIKSLLWKFIVSIIVLAGVFTFASTSLNADQQAPLPVETFKAKYEGYKTSTSWMKKPTMAERCDRTQTIYGAKPSVPGDYPVLVYVHGTTAEWSGNKEGQRFVEHAASQGFVAMAVTYSSGNSLNEAGLQRHAYCMFDQTHSSQDAMTVMCSVQGADCDKGVLLAGFSQGASIATIAKNYNDKVEAVWAIGLSAYIYPKHKIPTDTLPAPYGTRALANNKLSVNMGESSLIFSKKPSKVDMPSLKQLTGVDCGNQYDCIQADGSGYYMVANSEIKDKLADHCYWMNVNKWGGMSCVMSPKEFDPGFKTSSPTKWSMSTNLNWLRSHITE